MRFCLTVEFEGRKIITAMPSDWLQKRADETRNSEASKERREQLELKARNVSNSMFEKLRSQVEQDVNDYNAMDRFQSHRCRFKTSNYGFMVERESGLPFKGVQVTKNPGETTIKVTFYTRTDTMKATEDHIDIAPDYNNSEIDFGFGQGMKSKHAEEVSQFLLDHVFFGPKEIR